MPPAALISLAASFAPLSKLVPDVAPVPDSSTMPAILIGGCCASAAPANASAASVVTNPFMRPSSGTLQGRPQPWGGPGEGILSQRAAANCSGLHPPPSDLAK